MGGLNKETKVFEIIQHTGSDGAFASSGWAGHFSKARYGVGSSMYVFISCSRLACKGRNSSKVLACRSLSISPRDSRKRSQAGTISNRAAAVWYRLLMKPKNPARWDS